MPSNRYFLYSVKILIKPAGGELVLDEGTIDSGIISTGSTHEALEAVKEQFFGENP